MTELRVEILDRLESLQRHEAVWASLCTHPEAHPVVFAAVAAVNKDLIRPHVVVVHRGDAIVGLAVARIQYEKLPIRVGPATVFAPRLRVVRMSYEGILGDKSADVFVAVSEALSRPLQTGEADALFWDHVRDGSIEDRWSANPPSGLRRDVAPTVTSLHWVLSVDQTYQSFLTGLSKSERGNQKRNRERVDAEFAGRMTIKCYDKSADAETIEKHSREVAALTYQSAIGASFADQFWAVPVLRSALALGYARCYIAYIDDQPKAFTHGLVKDGVLHTTFMGYDPAYAQIGLGRYLNYHIIAEQCRDPEMKRIDFGFGHAEYKKRICKTNWTELDRYVFAARPKAMAVNFLRGGIGQMTRRVDSGLQLLGLRERLKQLWWRRIKQS